MAKTFRKQKKSSELRWHFPVLDHGESEGYRDPLLQYFEGDYSWYVAREIIQNSIDARDNQEAPVSVRFEKISLPVAEMPGLQELAERIKICHAKAKKENRGTAEQHFRATLEAASQKHVPVLRASDFNTSGLTGEDGDPNGKWHRLVKVIGDNEMTGAGGGSFGIGKGAPFAASIMRTVYYSTLNKDGQHIFQGKTRLLTHKWGNQEFRGVGFFGVMGYQSIRKAEKIPAEFLRSAQGTDVNIVGYNGGENWMRELAKSVLDNFWMAVYSGDLEVAISGDGKEIVIDKSVLHERLEEFSRDNGLVYYRAVITPDRKEEKQLPILGICRLYVKREERFPRNIAMMRKPKMVVDKWPFRILQDAYAGVFVCDNDDGNIILRGLEPPEHNEWRDSLDKENGEKAVGEIRGWIREILRKFAEEEGGDPEEIPELDRFLPYDEDAERLADSSRSRSQMSGSAASEESPEEIGAEREEIEDETEYYVRRPASIKNSRGAGPGIRHGGGGDGSGGSGEGGGGDDKGKDLKRINTSIVKFRTIFSGFDNGKTAYCLVMESLADQDGSINIVAVGEDSTVYAVPLDYAEPWQGGKKHSVEGSFINGLKLKKDEQIKIKIGVNSSARYALGIEKYEG